MVLLSMEMLACNLHPGDLVSGYHCCEYFSFR